MRRWWDGLMVARKQQATAEWGPWLNLLIILLVHYAPPHRLMTCCCHCNIHFWHRLTLKSMPTDDASGQHLFHLLFSRAHCRTMYLQQGNPLTKMNLICLMMWEAKCFKGTSSLDLTLHITRQLLITNKKDEIKIAAARSLLLHSVQLRDSLEVAT